MNPIPKSLACYFIFHTGEEQPPAKQCAYCPAWCCEEHRFFHEKMHTDRSLNAWAREFGCPVRRVRFPRAR